MKTNDIPLKNPIKLQEEIQKIIWNFPKFVRFLGHFLKKQYFWKMGMAGIKQLPCPPKIASFSGNLNGEALLKVSFKNIDWFQKYKALKSKIVKKHNYIRKMAVKNNFSIQSIVFLKPVNIFEWNFQEGFPIEGPKKWSYFGWAWQLFNACHAHFQKTLLFQKMP